MVNKTTSFKKKGKGKKGNFKKNEKQVPLPWRILKLDLSLKLSASTTKGVVTGSGNYPKYLANKKDGKVNKSIYNIHVIDVYFTSVHSSPWVFDTGSVAMISNLKQEL